MKKFIKRILRKSRYSQNIEKVLKTEKNNQLKNHEERKVLIANTKVIENKVVFINYQKDFCGNSAFIAKELKKQKPDLDIVFIVHKRNLDNIPKGIRGVITATNDSFFELLSAKIWVDNAFECIFSSVPKKDGQIYINTWHATAGFKDLNNERAGLIELSRKYVDFILASSSIDETIFKNSIWTNSKILNLGNPKNDQLFSSVDARKKVTSYFNIPYNSKIVLYAPTFRDTNLNSSQSQVINPYISNFTALRDTISKLLGDNVYILVRTHHKDSTDQRDFLKNSMSLETVNDSLYLQSDNCNTSSNFILNSNSYKNIEELIMTIDIGISDYSSWVNQAMLIEKPIFLYTKDFDSYTRGFAYSLDSTPFTVSKTWQELLDNISKFSFESYKLNCKKYIQSNHFITDNKSSQRSAQLLCDLLTTDC